MQAASSPISGILGDKYNRTHIVAVGCFLWGIMTAVIGLSTSLHQARILSTASEQLLPGCCLLCLHLYAHMAFSIGD